ncbi:MAG: GspH/FimT family pseudopilin [Endozoicomonadaceae bacterium]|nr:GspH/FimT family pseudopilin [Endozoicomonadaceae bacterium]
MQKQAAGFTLIELLIVILLIGITIGIATVIPNSNYGQKAVAAELSKLGFLFTKASEKALLSGSELGFSLEDNQYRWWKWDRSDEKWQPLSDKTWAPYRLPENITATLDDNNTENLLKEAAQGPAIVFYADGIMTPVNVTFFIKDNNTISKTLKSDGVTSFAQ